MKTTKNIKYLLRLLWNYNKSYFLVMAVLFAFPCIANLVQVVFPREILVALEKHEGIRAITLAVFMCLLVFCVEVFLSVAEYKKYGGSGDFGIFLNRLLAEAAAGWPYEKFEDFSFREKYHFAVMCMKEGTADAVLGYAVSVAGSLFSLCSLLYISNMVIWWLWIVIALSVIVNIGCEIYRAKYDYRSYDEYSAIDMRMVYARDVLTWKEFSKESRIFSMSRYISDTANHYINLLSRLQEKRALRTFMAYFLTCVFDFLQQVAIFGYIAYQAYKGEISVADFSMLTLALVTVSGLCIDIAKNIIRIGEASKYVGAYVDIIGDKKKMGDTGERCLDIKGKLCLRFENVNFSYPGTDFMALEEISFTFDSDKKYAIVGANGSGKTTFINLLTGMYSPTSGCIFCNEQRMSDISAESWRKMFSVVCQDFNIYAYTAKENVCMFHDGSDVKAGKAMERAGIGWLDMESYLTSEYEEGRELSGGEAQKLAIARAIYKNAEIFVFDEPTAALSPTSEQELYESIFREMRDKMLFFISHRLASCRMCDEILVFENGRIVENGSHDELMRRGGLYSDMFRAQASLYGE